MIEAPDKCVLICHPDTGEVELWGPSHVSVRAVVLRKDIERVDYEETTDGLSFSGLKLLAYETNKPKVSAQEFYEIACRLLLQAGHARNVAETKALQIVVDKLARRFPFVINELNSLDLRAEVRRQIQKAELQTFNDAIRDTTDLLAVRRQERDRSLRLAQGDQT